MGRLSRATWRAPPAGGSPGATGPGAARAPATRRACPLGPLAPPVSDPAPEVHQDAELSSALVPSALPVPDALLPQGGEAIRERAAGSPVRTLDVTPELQFLEGGVDGGRAGGPRPPGAPGEFPHQFEARARLFLQQAEKGGPQKARRDEPDPERPTAASRGRARPCGPGRSLHHVNGGRTCSRSRAGGEPVGAPPRDRSRTLTARFVPSDPTRGVGSPVAPSPPTRSNSLPLRWARHNHIPRRRRAPALACSSRTSVAPVSVLI